MKIQIRKGFGFGLTSGVITTMGLMVGLNSGTHSKLVVMGGILTIAIADAFSDALGIHISEEVENRHTAKQIWIATAATFLSKLLFTLLFVIPVLLLDLKSAVIVSICWGLLVLGLLSYKMAKDGKENPLKVIGEHIIIATLVITLTHFIGEWVSKVFV